MSAPSSQTYLFTQLIEDQQVTYMSSNVTANELYSDISKLDISMNLLDARATNLELHDTVLDQSFNNLDASMVKAFDDIFDLQDISINLITLNAFKNTAEGNFTNIESSLATLTSNVTQLESIHGVSELTSIEISNNLDSLNSQTATLSTQTTALLLHDEILDQNINNLDASMVKAFKLMNDISGFEDIFDFQDISENFIILNSQIVTLNTQTTALETHHLVLDASIVDLYSDITVNQTVTGIQQMNIDALDISVSSLETKTAALEAHDLVLDAGVAALEAHDLVLDAGVAALEAHDLVLDASIVDLYSDITVNQTVTGIQQMNIDALDISVNILEAHNLVLDVSVTLLRANELVLDANVASLSAAALSLDTDIASLVTKTAALDVSLNQAYGGTANLNINDLLVTTVSAENIDVSNLNVNVNLYTELLTLNSSNIAIGSAAGKINQNNQSIAIGKSAGYIEQAFGAIAIGRLPGYSFQGTNSIAIGSDAGKWGLGNNSIAIGNNAAVGLQDQSDNMIVLNATGNILNPTSNGFFVQPIRGGSDPATKHLTYDTSTGEITYDEGFTGVHRNLLNNNIDSTSVGLIVSSSKYYINRNLTIDPTMHESLPYCKISNSDNDKNVFGVLSQNKTENDGYAINSVGEGGIWISNKNGILEGGDYISSSSVAGYGMKQDDDILHNYTVAKITCDCNFTLIKIPKQKLKTITIDISYINPDFNMVHEGIGEHGQSISGEEITAAYNSANYYLIKHETQIVYDSAGEPQFEDDLDSLGNQIMKYQFETRFLEADGTVISTEADYLTKLNAGEQVYISCFVGCTYHCG